MIDPNTIKQLMSDRGTEVTFRRFSDRESVDYDPTLGKVSSGTENNEIVKVVFTNYSEHESDGTNTQRGDRRVLMSNFDTMGDKLIKAPTVNDEFVGESDAVTVVDVRTLRDNNCVIGYICQVRE